MDSDLQHQQYHHHFQLPKQQMDTGCGGLSRYRSAPSSYFSAFIDTATATGFSDFSPPRPLSPETETILARFVTSVTGNGGGTDPPSSHKLPENSMVGKPELNVKVKQEPEQFPILSSNDNSGTGYNSSSSSSHQVIYHSSKKPPLARRASNNNSMGGESSFRVPSSSGMDVFPTQMKKLKTGIAAGGNSLGLTRHNSSPAGLFDDIIIENGYLVTSSNKTTDKEEFSSQASVLNDQMNFSSAQGQPTSSGMLNTNSDAGNVGITGFPMDPWNDTSIFSDQLPGLESGFGEFKPSENQNEEVKNGPPGLLAHHLSLPKASMEKLLQLNESVPCQIRAKRGCATHPRSIAERVRRSKISERMRKLQHVVPNMDKQTNTAEMLDLAVDYIKDLQEQVKTLASRQARCTCST